MGNTIPGYLLTTAMAVIPPTDVDRALEMALRLLFILVPLTAATA